MAFRFKQFEIDDRGCGMKLGTDSVLLGAWAQVDGCNAIADVGCGSGVLALMAAQRNAQARILALDINAEACEAARANADASPWSQRVSVFCCDAMDICQSMPVGFEIVDMIICNPPYFKGGLVSPEAARAQARHESALSAESALALASRWLSPNGSIALVTPTEADLVFCAEMLKLKMRRRCRVATSHKRPPTRMLWQFSRIDGPCVETSITIGDDCYREITKDFYLDSH